MAKFKVGYIVGSLAKGSINRKFAEAAVKLAPESLELVEIEIKDLPVYTYEYDADYPAPGRAYKAALAEVDALVWFSPEYNRSITAATKNAVEWASHPSGQSELGKPMAVAGAAYAIGTAVGQSQLRNILSTQGANVLGGNEVYVDFYGSGIVVDGEIAEGSRDFIANFWNNFADFVAKLSA